MDQELVEYLDRRFNDFRNALRNELRNDLRSDLNDLRTDRRHFDVVAEHLMGKIKLVAEGVIGVDQKVDRLTAEIRSEFQNVDRRLLHLQAQVIGRD